MYFGFYTCITELINVFQILHVYYGNYTGLTELILVFRIFIRVLQNLVMYFRFYTCLTDRILILRILFFCDGTHRYNKSELIIIVSHTGSDQTYADTYQVWTLVHSRYRS